MKSTLVALLMLIIPALAAAGTIDEDYFAARDAYIEKFKPTEINADVPESVLKEEELARADLEKQLRRIVGASEIKGMPGAGTINLDTLFKGELGFGLLDGLLYSSADDK